MPLPQLLNLVNERYLAAEGLGEDEEREEEQNAGERDITLDLTDAEGQDAVALAMLCKSTYKARWGQLNHPTKYLGVCRTSAGRAEAIPRSSLTYAGVC